MARSKLGICAYNLSENHNLGYQNSSYRANSYFQNELLYMYNYAKKDLLVLALHDIVLQLQWILQ